MHDLGKRDGEAVCARHDQAPLRKQFTDSVVRANPEVQGRSCGEIMTLALRSIPSDQLDAVHRRPRSRTSKVTGKTGPSSTACTTSASTARSRDGGGPWKVSCCVPGQE